MVSWQRFVGLAFQVADTKGVQFAGIDEGADFITALSQLWQEDQQSIKQMTEQQTINYLNERVVQ